MTQQQAAVMAAKERMQVAVELHHLAAAGLGPQVAPVQQTIQGSPCLPGILIIMGCLHCLCLWSHCDVDGIAIELN